MQMRRASKPKSAPSGWRRRCGRHTGRCASFVTVTTMRTPRRHSPAMKPCCATTTRRWAMDDEVYVCMRCGHEGHPDEFGVYCPKCGTDLDELEASFEPEARNG